jgi:RNA polymerase sigma-70 factor (ECF subfamily)
MINEETLIEMLRNREQRAISIVYEKYGEALMGVIFRLLGDQERSEEALQETFLKIWKYGDSYDPEKSRLFTWMMTIARNTAYDASRKKSFRDRKRIQPLENHVSIIEKANSVQTYTDAIGLQELIDKLNTKYATIIDILYFQGYTQSEAAKELDIPLGTVKTRVRKAFQYLKQMLSYGE